MAVCHDAQVELRMDLSTSSPKMRQSVSRGGESPAYAGLQGGTSLTYSGSSPDEADREQSWAQRESQAIAEPLKAGRAFYSGVGLSNNAAVDWLRGTWSPKKGLLSTALQGLSSL